MKYLALITLCGFLTGCEKWERDMKEIEMKLQECKKIMNILLATTADMLQKTIVQALSGFFCVRKVTCNCGCWAKRLGEQTAIGILCIPISYVMGWIACFFIGMALGILKE